jgi:hypothetical protein
MFRALIGLSLFLSFSAAECFAAGNPPAAEDVNTLTELAKLTANSFYQHTFEVRMRHEFAGRFFSEEDRLALYSSAYNSSRQLADLIVQFQDIVRRIEQYQDKDWDQRFGRTGLYEKASSQLFSTRLSKFGIDYYAVLAAADKDVNASAEKLLKQMGLFNETENPFYLQLVKGKTLALLAKTEPNYRPAAEKVFIELRERSDTSQRLAFMASIEQIKLESAKKDIEAGRLARDLIKTNLTDDLEVLLPLAFLQRTLGMVDAYNELLQSNPQARVIAAGITLAWLETGRSPANPLDGALAAEAALREGPEKHKELLIRLAEQNTSASPVIDYAAAVVLADSNESQAVYLLIRAGEVLDDQSAEVLGLTGEQIAAQAAELAYRLFVKEPNQCELATGAFENYFDLAGQSADPNLRYIYTQVLTLCGQYQQAVDMLKNILPSAGELYSKAQLDLISAGIASEVHHSIFDWAGYAPLFSQYLRGADDCVYLGPVTTLLQGYLREIEILEADQPTYIDTLKNSKKIAGFLYGCSADSKRASILAEFTALDPNCTDEELTSAVKLLSALESAGADIDVLRAQARLERRGGNFAEAARLWARIAQFNEISNQTLADSVEPNPRSWQWWRAKYYQIECAAKAGDNSSDIAHAIDVLRATYKDIPAPWSAKLESLRRVGVR